MCETLEGISSRFSHGLRIHARWKERMGSDRKTLSVMFRKTQFPVIVSTGTQTLVTKTATELVSLLLNLPKRSSWPNTKIIDPSGEEFWFNSQRAVLSPGFTFKRWTKKQIIDLYNSTRESSQKAYTVCSLSNKRLKQIVTEVCDLLS